MKKALICGISGQDGAYLAQLLLTKNYEVWGTSRDVQNNEFNGLRALGIFEKVNLVAMRPESLTDVLQVLSSTAPDEVYNLTGQSSVGVSFHKPVETMQSIALSTLNQLEAIRLSNKTILFFNAGSSECFGNTGPNPANECTTFRPHSPYAAAKSSATYLVSVYRETYDLFACTGMLFNHESPLRSSQFVTQKIVNAASRIAHGDDEKLILGNLKIRRDWGWAPEYVDAMWRMLQHETPEDFVIATGTSQSLEDFVRVAFETFGLDWNDHTTVDPSLYRPSDPNEIIGNSEKANQLLQWAPKTVGAEIPRKMCIELIR